MGLECKFDPGIVETERALRKKKRKKNLGSPGGKDGRERMNE